MWRYVMGGVAAILLLAGGWMIVRGQAHADAPLAAATAPAPAATARAGDTAAEAAPPDLPAASDAQRARQRFARYDRDRDGKVTRAEFLEPRRKAFAKLDRDGDGRLSFDEWAARTVDRFGAADRDHSGALDAQEFAATAPKRKPRRATPCAEPAHEE
jgi:hypothetical protein